MLEFFFKKRQVSTGTAYISNNICAGSSGDLS